MLTSLKAEQKQGQVKPTEQLQGVSINNDNELEWDADNKGNSVVQDKTNIKTIIQKSRIYFLKQ